jgi:uncharacterized protein (DUF2132 family)
MDAQPKNPLHGLTLAALLEELVTAYGWEELGRQVRVNCFQNDPSVPSSLKFLRRTPWAREKLESFYLWHLREQKRRAAAAPGDPGAGGFPPPATPPVLEDSAENAASDAAPG